MMVGSADPLFQFGVIDSVEEIDVQFLIIKRNLDRQGVGVAFHQVLMGVVIGKGGVLDVLHASTLEYGTQGPSVKIDACQDGFHVGFFLDQRRLETQAGGEGIKTDGEIRVSLKIIVIIVSAYQL
jgi:hypothetical protein